MDEEEMISKLCNELDGNLVNKNFCVIKVGGTYPEMQIRKGIKGIWLGYYHKCTDKDIAGNEFSNIASGGVFDQMYGGKFDKLECVGEKTKICNLSGKDEDVIIIKELEDNKEEISVKVSHKGVGIADFHLITKLEGD